MASWLIRWWQRLGKPQRVALLIGLLVTLLRLTLIGRGSMAFVDEQRYVTAMLGLRALGEGHAQEFLQAINSMGARPGDGLWRCLSGVGQAALLTLFQLNPNAPPSLQVPQAFNVLIMSVNAWLLYRIYRRFFTVGYALMGVALYSSLVNTNLYLRHILPYDHSLFFFLAALYLALSSPGRIGRQLWVGVLSGISYAVYPGYFLGPALLLGLVLLPVLIPASQMEGRSRTGQIAPLLAHLVGLVFVLGTFEILAQLSDTSYLASSRYIATTVTQGSFEEGFSFIGKYFWQVEGAFGLLLLTLFAGGLFLSVRDFRAAITGLREKATSQFSLTTLVLLGFLGWLGYAIAVQLGHKLVFYGRIIHFFVPLIVLGSLMALQQIARIWQHEKGLMLGIGAVALWHVAAFGSAYRAVAYPADVAYDMGIQDARQIVKVQTTVCAKNLVFYRVFGPRIRDQRTSEYPKYQVVNFAYLLPVNCYEATSNPGKVVASVPYFMKYTPYQFEGHSPIERTLLQTHEYAFRILRAN